MPSMVNDLTQVQRMWLYDNQRTLSEEGSSSSSPEGEDRSARSDPSQQQPTETVPEPKDAKPAIFRPRPAPENVHPAPSASPSWTTQHDEPENRNGCNDTVATPTSSQAKAVTPEERGFHKRRKVQQGFPSYYSPSHSYHHPGFHPPHPPYYDHPPFPPPHHSPYHHYHAPHHSPYHPHAGNSPIGAYEHHHHPFHHAQQQYHHPEHMHHPHLHHPAIPPQRAGGLMDRRDDAPSPTTAKTTERFPSFPNAGDKLTWQESYENLVAYKEHYGDCSVPQKYKGNPKLGGWVNKQRKKYRNPAKYGQLKDEHIDMLTSLGFKWQ